MSRANEDVDNGWLCDRGRYGFDITKAPDRIVKPHIRRGSSLEPCSWDEAAQLVSKHLRKVINENRGAEVAAVGSPLLSNEEAYAIRHFFEDVIKTADIDFQTDTNQPLEPELIDFIGLSGTIKDLENDRLFIFAGADPAVEQPVAALRIKKAIAQNDAKAIFIGSYDKRLGNFPVQNIRIPFGAEPDALDFVAAILSGKTPGANSNLDSKSLSLAAEQVRNAGNVHIIAGRSFFTHPERLRFLNSLLNLKKALGAKLSILPTQANFIGVSHFGLYGEPEHSFECMLSRIDSGEIKTLFVFGANPVDEYPDRKYVQDALKKLEFLIVAAPFKHPTASLASVVFPQAMNPDYGGSVVNIEGRIQQFKPTIDRSQQEIRPAWGILGDISSILELGPVWYGDSQVREDIAKKLNGLDGLLNLPARGLIIPFLNHEGHEPREIASSPAKKSADTQTYILQASASVHHFGWLTEHSENLMRIAGGQSVLIHPDDAAKEGIADDQPVILSNGDATLGLTAQVSVHVNRGEVLVINSFAENPVNSLMKRERLITRVTVKKV
jgi:NADH-quinone oxidoreductase subunit G